ncbi:MAG: hypothetical protein HYZ14_16160 [Bacteroidetes bacterium]|nr:hypothetical protein [Bacteroidota bacterium]
MKCFFVLVCLQISTCFGSSGKIDKNAVFPSDINQYPILFVKFIGSYYKDGQPIYHDGNYQSMQDLPSDETNQLILDFMLTHPELEHKIVAFGEFENCPVEKYKYSVHYATQEFEGDIMQVSGGFQEYKVFKSVFYIKDRQSGKNYQAYYDKRPTENLTTSSNLPVKVPKDKDFFKDLSNYIEDLNNYGATKVTEREAKRFSSGDAKRTIAHPGKIVLISAFSLAIIASIIVLNS